MRPGTSCAAGNKCLHWKWMVNSVRTGRNMPVTVCYILEAQRWTHLTSFRCPRSNRRTYKVERFRDKRDAWCGRPEDGWVRQHPAGGGPPGIPCPCHGSVPAKRRTRGLAGFLFGHTGSCVVWHWDTQSLVFGARRERSQEGSREGLCTSGGSLPLQRTLSSHCAQVEPCWPR